MEGQHPNPDHELKSAPDFKQLSDLALERANELNTDSFEDRIEALAVTNPELAADLNLTVRVAEAVVAAGGEALVVGGFARDDALSRITGEAIQSKDIDVEVYGVEFERLKALLDEFGTINIVGDQFTVAKLTNPETGHDLDFSIPRRDSKTGAGHKGFQVTGDPSMSIQEAARRRDFTINALALNPLTGEMHDYYGGLADLKNGILRATDTDLFADDPLRVLRAMQFAGRFNLTVDPQTAELCRTVDLSELPSERIGEEWDKLVLKSPRPSLGLEVARELGILDKLHPDLAGLELIEQEPDWHPEGNVWNHTKLAADAAARVVREESLEGDDALVVMYGALLHDLGKKTTTQRQLKKGVMRITAHGHEQTGVEPSNRFLKQIHARQAVVDKILPIVREHLYHVASPNPSDAALRRFAGRLHPGNIRLYDLVSRCDSNGRGLPWEPVTASHSIYERALAINVQEKPLERVVEGGDLKVSFGIADGILLGRTVELMYELQMDGDFVDQAGALAYYRTNQSNIEAEVQQRVEAYHHKRTANALARKAEIDARNLERKRLKLEKHHELMAEQSDEGNTL